jgi:hypothetical protein
MKNKLLALTLLLSALIVFPSSNVPVLSAHAVSCKADSATTLPVSLAGKPITIYGDDIGEQSMKLLWDLGMQWNTHDFGKAIASEQNWFGECKYPGIGLGTGSGSSWHDRNVTLWIWADAVDMTQARATILNRVAVTPDVIITTTPTTTTTTTTVPPTTTVAPTTTVPDLPTFEHLYIKQQTYYPYNIIYTNFSCEDHYSKPKVIHYMLKDNFTEVLVKNFYSSCKEFTFDYPKNISNCWQVAPVNAIGQGEWSNKVCYQAPAPTTTTTTIPKVLASSNAYTSYSSFVPEPKKLKVKQTLFYRTGAICFDGWRSYSTGSGTCSWHGGVHKWLGYNKTTWVKKTVPIIPKVPIVTGNCYGCISSITGRPRTNYVTGYTRSNGTYVNGYWRS